jgi:hypothetical protein
LAECDAVNVEVVGSSPTPGAHSQRSPMGFDMPGSSVRSPHGRIVRRVQDDVCVAVPIVIFVACLSAGVFLCARWLPGLAAGSVGGLAFLVVCGLAGGGVAVVGLRIYSIVNALHRGSIGFLNRDIVADGLGQLLWEAGLLFGLAAAVYLLAPRAAPTQGRSAGLS